MPEELDDQEKPISREELMDMRKRQAEGMPITELNKVSEDFRKEQDDAQKTRTWGEGWKDQIPPGMNKQPPQVKQ